MKKLTRVFAILVLCGSLSSCYTYTFQAGNGAQTGIQIKEKNHYLIGGLAPLSQSDPSEMAGDATDYTVNIQHSFVDGLLSIITFGIYTPTTTTVTK